LSIAMDEKSCQTSMRPNREGRPMRQRGVSFNVLPLREESTVPSTATAEPYLVDYASIRENKQLNLSDFLHSDNPVTFLLFTIWHLIRLLGYLVILPYTLIKHLYLLMLQVYGVRRRTTSTNTSDLFSISSSQSSIQQQRPIVWLLTLIDYVLFQLTRLPDVVRHLIDSMRRHIDGTVLNSFNLIDTCTNHQISRTVSLFKSVFSLKTHESSFMKHR
jgi:hypothetical protein